MIRQKVILAPQSKEEILGDILKSFGIGYQFISLQESEYFDIFDIKLTLGTKLSKLESIMMDVGLSMSSKAPPRGYPILENGIFRLEVQKKNIPSPKFDKWNSLYNPDFYAPVMIGVDASGKNISIDLNSLPNLLIAGTTGSGKSMLLHSIILSLLSKRVELNLVDPKMVEFSQYQGCRKISNIVHNTEEALDLVKDLIQIMENRFRLLRSLGLRHAKEAKDMDPIVLVIDEWADIVSYSKDLEKYISLLAQKGRAAGISIILSTQRPSTKVVSGLIKANFVGRICMRVSSATDSRIILDQNGGEKIRETGAGLFLDGKSTEPIFFKAPHIQTISDELKNMGLEPKRQGLWNRIFG